MTNAYSGSDKKADASTKELRAQTGEVVENVGEKAGEVVDKVKQQAGAQIGTQLDTQKGRVSETLGSVALAIRQTGTKLHEQDQGNMAQYTDKAAEQIERMSTYLRQADMRQMTGDLERLARRQPALFLGGALALGLFGARFLKSSSQQNRQEWEGYSGGMNDYSSSGRGGYSYSGYSYSGSSAASSPYIDRSRETDYQSEGSTTDGNNSSSGQSNVRQRTWTGTNLEES